MLRSGCTFHSLVLAGLTSQVKDLMAERLPEAQDLERDQGGLLVAHFADRFAGKLAESFFQFAHSPRFCDPKASTR